MSKALLPLALVLARPTASQSVSGAIDVAGLDANALVPAPDPLPNALVPAPDSLLERERVSNRDVQAAVHKAFLEDLTILRGHMRAVLSGTDLRQLRSGQRARRRALLDSLRPYVDNNRVGPIRRHLIAEYAELVRRRGDYPLFMKHSIKKACQLFVRSNRIPDTADKCAPVACPSLESARAHAGTASARCAQLIRCPRRRYMKVFDVDEVIMRGVVGVDASGNSGASNWVPNTRTGRVFIKSADEGEAKVARGMAGIWTRPQSLLLIPYAGLRWMVRTGRKVRSRPRGARRAIACDPACRAQDTPYVWVMPNIQHPIKMLLPRAPSSVNLVGKWDLKGQARAIPTRAQPSAASGAISAPRGDAGRAQPERAQKRSGGLRDCWAVTEFGDDGRPARHTPRYYEQPPRGR